jgi:hypothetical protein
MASPPCFRTRSSSCSCISRKKHYCRPRLKERNRRFRIYCCLKVTLNLISLIKSPAARVENADIGNTIRSISAEFRVLHRAIRVGSETLAHAI